MKGLTHFWTGIAAASCFPSAVNAAVNGNPLLMLLGGAAAILPDTVDFRVGRFLHRAEINIIPDPLDVDPGEIANGVLKACELALLEQRAISIKLHTVALSADEWQQYRMRIHSATREVTVTIGPVVNTGRQPLRENLASGRSATITLPRPLLVSYLADTVIDIFDGPVFRIEPEPQANALQLEFIPWHRAWSHSLIVSLLLGLTTTALFGATAGGVAAVAHASHVLLDMPGFLGCNLWFPFSHRRTPGAMWWHAGDSGINLAFLWGALLVLAHNLAAAVPGIELHSLRFFVRGGILPLLIVHAAARWAEKKRQGGSDDAFRPPQPYNSITRSPF